MIYSIFDTAVSLHSITAPKNERLIERIIEYTTEEGDTVLDFHIGSGTTASSIAN